MIAADGWRLQPAEHVYLLRCMTGCPAQGLRFCLQYVTVGIVGGSDQAKICEQLGANGEPPRHMCLPPLTEGQCFTHPQGTLPVPLLHCGRGQ